MLPHIAREVTVLSANSALTPQAAVNGWVVDEWAMTRDDANCAVAAYSALVAGGASNEVIDLLAEAGIDLPDLLADTGKDDITRADLTEIVAAATMVASLHIPADLLHMPNVPKMSRRKSDSGVDIMYVKLGGVGALSPDETLTLVSVKHTIDSSTAGMRWKLDKSLSETELTKPYLVAQLRVLSGRLVSEGVAADSAARVYLFMHDYPALGNVSFLAVGVSPSDIEDDFRHHVGLLTQARPRSRFRMVHFPDLRTVHELCP